MGRQFVWILIALLGKSMDAQSSSSSPAPNVQAMSDASIQAAIDRGQRTNSKDLLNNIKQHIQWYHVGDTVKKQVTFVVDADKIAMEASEQKRQLREPLTIADVRAKMELGVVEVLFEASCAGNSFGCGSLDEWGHGGGVHVVLKIDGVVLQPVDERAGQVRALHLQLFGPANASQQAWFTFPKIPVTTKKVVVTVISGRGDTK